MVIDLMQRRPRERSALYLSRIRLLPCLGCDVDPATVAAHLRMSSAAHNKVNAGIGAKPSDIWVTPLCPVCHDEQHEAGESAFWERLGLDPFQICLELSAAETVLDMREIIYAAKARRK